MRVQISSGQGPAECELAVAMLYEELRKEAGDVRLVGWKEAWMHVICGV
jgi:peptide chain release factor